MITIDGHTFDETLLTETGWVIDAGARGFNLPKELAKIKPRVEYKDFNYNTYCLDIEDFEKPEGNIVTVFKHAALMAKAGEVEAHYFGAGDGNFIKGLNEQPYDGPDRPCETKKVNAITLQDIYNEIGTNIDLLKLDIESSEYEILANLEPIPRMITCELHQHCNPGMHKEWIERVLVHMGQKYYLNLYSREWPLYLFMDCLFIRKDLLK